jgi:hypothetical protein
MWSLVAWLLLVLATLPACALTREPSRKPRTAIEQLLLSQAVERSLADLAVPLPTGVSVSVEITGLTRLASYLSQPTDLSQSTGQGDGGLLYGPPTDLSYVREVVCARLGALGFRIRDPGDDPPFLVKVLVHALGTEQGVNFFGMPPVQSSFFPFALPELTLYKAQNQKAHMRVSLDLYDRQTGTLIRSTPIYTGNTYFNQYTVFFFISFRRTDLVQAP